MEGDCHDSVCREECLFDTIAVMAVNIDVEDSLVCLEQLKDAKDAVIDIAEAASFKLLGMVKSTRPIDSNV